MIVGWTKRRGHGFYNGSLKLRDYGVVSAWERHLSLLPAGELFLNMTFKYVDFGNYQELSTSYN